MDCTRLQYKRRYPDFFTYPDIQISISFNGYLGVHTIYHSTLKKLAREHSASWKKYKSDTKRDVGHFRLDHTQMGRKAGRILFEGEEGIRECHLTVCQGKQRI